MAVAFANAVAARLHLDGRLHAFSQFKYAYLTFNKHRPDRHLLVSSYPQEWLDIYSANRYQRIDPVVRAAHSRCAPFMWHDTPRHHRGSALPEDLQPGAGIRHRARLQLCFARSRQQPGDLVDQRHGSR